MSEYIKREDVYQTLKLVFYVDGCEPSVTEIDVDAFEAIPAADVEPVVRGEWKDRCVRDWVCSLCGCEIQKVRFYDGYRYTSLPDFCPDCGAVMTEAGLKKIAERSGSGE